MPRVNRIRVANIRLDGGKKIIGDKIWEPNGKSTIFLLENGGGKTSIIQLLHQVILPNHEIQGRSLKSIVTKGNTINVAVEWLPEGESQPMFITGFSFYHHGVKQGKSNTTYEYFNYIVECDTTDSLSLDTLPFIQDGQITSYSNLRSFFKQESNTQVFSNNYTYQEVLEQYGILASEWRNISKVNGAEAGVTAFFDKTDKTRTLIERLLIPAFLDNLFSNEEEKNAITNAFKVYKDRLLELPLLEKNLNDFQAVIKNADAIIDSTQRYITVKEELETARLYLSQLFYTAQREQKSNNDRIAEIQKELEQIVASKKQLQWKIDSHEVHLAKIESEKATEQYSSAEEDKGESEKLLKALERKEREQRAARHYNEYTQYYDTFLEMSAKLDAAEMQTDEKLKELNKSRERISSGNQFFLIEQKKHEQEMTNRLKELKKKIKSEGHALNETQTTLTETKVKVATLKAFISQYNLETMELNQELGDFKQVSVEESIEAVKGYLESLNDLLKEKKSAVKKLEETYGFLKEEIQNNKHKLIDIEKNIEGAEQSFEKFSNEENELMKSLNLLLFTHVRGNLFDRQESILHELNRMKENWNKEIIQLSVKTEQLQQYKKSIDEAGYHLHPELESVKRFLASRELFVVSGIEWLVEATLPQEKKEEIIAKNPLLPFSLLIEKNQIKKVIGMLAAFKEELTVPVFFINKQGMETGMRQGKFIALQAESYLFHQFNVRFTKEEWEEWADQLDGEIAVLQEKRNERRAKEKEVQNLEYQLQQFWSAYSKDEREKLSLKIASLKKEFAELQENIEELTVSKNQTELEMKKQKKEAETDQGNINTTQQLLNRIQDFIKRYANILLTQQDYTELNEKVATMQDKENAFKKSIENLAEKMERENEVKMSINSRIHDLKRDIHEYKLEKNATGESISREEYDKGKHLLKQLNSKFSTEKEQMDIVRKSKEDYDKLVQREIGSIKALTYSIDLFEQGSIIFQESLLKQYETDLREEKDRYASIQANHLQKLTDHTIKQTLYETENEKVWKRYEEKPYQYSENHIQEVEAVIQNKNSLLDKESVRKQENQKALDQSYKFVHALTELESQREFFTTVDKESEFLSYNQWTIEEPIQDVHRAREEFDEKRTLITKQDTLIKEKIQAMDVEIEKTGNVNLITMSRDFSRVLESSKGNYEAMLENFYAVLKAMDKFKESLELQRIQSEKGRNEIIEMMFERGELLYKNTCELPKYSQIEEKGQNVFLFTIRWPKYETEESKYKLRTFVDDILSELTVMQEKGASQEALDQLFQEKVNDAAILNCYADVDRCVLKALKPRNAQLAEMKEYFKWDEVSGWSNGEKHASRMAMFITLNTFIRKKRFSRENSWKFLIADNPFGEASAEHVVKPMIVLAKKTNTQLFCLTGIEDKRIQMEFDTVISNQYVKQRGKLFLYSETTIKEPLEMESLFYSKQQELKFQ